MIERAAGVEGVVLDVDGIGVADALVGAPTCKRGPWTTTDARGAFRLPGLHTRVTRLVVLPPGVAYEPFAVPLRSASRPPPGVRRIVRLDAEGRVARANAMREVRVALLTPVGTEVAPGLPVCLFREDDGETSWGTSDWAGPVVLDVPVEGRGACASATPTTYGARCSAP